MAIGLVEEKPRVMVLRVGHRVQRDVRVTTHVCLTARALGADGVFISDVQDRRIADTLDRVRRDFGGDFTIETGRPWRSVVSEWQRLGGKVVHLTAYGTPLPRVISEIRGFQGDKLIVVGAEKVPVDLFEIADWNVAVTNQPLSEVSALGIFLDWLFSHSRLESEFRNAKLRIIPSARGKKVVRS